MGIINWIGGDLYLPLEKLMNSFNIQPNERYGKLTVQYECVVPPDSTVRGRHYYCLCSCGQYVIVPGTYLHRAKKKSCGACTKRGRPKKDKRR